MKKRIKSQKGSLLIEALLSIVILSVSLVIIIQSMGHSVKASAYVIDYSRAVMLAENKMVDLRRSSSGSLSVLSEGRFESPYEDYQYKVVSQSADGSDAGNLKEVDIQVSWASAGRKGALQTKSYFLQVSEINEE